jgi:uncharacterized protein YndB with AHSA1/START domain
VTAQPILHGSFTVTRHVQAPTDRVFAGFADLCVRRCWFRIPGKPGTAHHELDFRVGGGEIARGTFTPVDVPEHIEYHSRFLDIVTNERIVYTYELLLDDRRRSVSLASIELTPEGAGTRITLIEQFAFLIYTDDGHDDIAERKGGTQLQLNGLIAVVEGANATGSSPGQ